MKNISNRIPKPPGCVAAIVETWPISDGLMHTRQVTVVCGPRVVSVEDSVRPDMKGGKGNIISNQNTVVSELCGALCMCCPNNEPVVDVVTVPADGSFNEL